MARGGGSGAVHVEGLAELVRDLGKAQKALKPKIRAELKDVAGIVAKEAQKIATARNLVRSGDLVKGIRPGMRGSTALVRSIANRRGFPYPALYEFGQGGTAARPFLAPAVRAKTDEVRDALEVAIDRILDAADL